MCTSNVNDFKIVCGEYKIMFLLLFLYFTLENKQHKILNIVFILYNLWNKKLVTAASAFTEFSP